MINQFSWPGDDAISLPWDIIWWSPHIVSVILLWQYLAARKRREITDSAHRSDGQRQLVSHLPLSSHRPISHLLIKYDITVVDTEYDCERFLSEKVPHAPVIIGLDCEWVNREGVISAPVALLQLSFPNGQCLLARVFKMTSLGPHLTDLLTDKRSVPLSLSCTYKTYIPDIPLVHTLYYTCTN